MVKKGQKPAANLESGTAARLLPQPQRVGEISAAEAQEIKTINALIAAIEADAVKASQLHRMARNNLQQYLKQLLEDRGLDTGDTYNIDDESGVIMRTHERVAPAGVEVLEGEER